MAEGGQEGEESNGGSDIVMMGGAATPVSTPTTINNNNVNITPSVITKEQHHSPNEPIALNIKSEVIIRKK